MMRTTSIHPVIAMVFLLGLAALGATAATPPDRMHYQGVLRDASDHPLDGSYDMVFRFWSAETGGDEILIDRHLVANGQAVTVTGGLFSVDLGSGEVLDGSGPGIYTSLSQVFGDYANVWLEVQVQSETLSPRIAVTAAGYALNANRLEGRSSAEFLNTSSAAQTKKAKLVLDATGQPTVGIEAHGDTAGGYFADSNDSGYAYVAADDYGIKGYGSFAGGYFKDSDGSGYARVGVGNYGINGYGTYAGAYFTDSDGSGYAYIGKGDVGVESYGNVAGGYFGDRDDSSWAYVGYGDYGLWAHGQWIGGVFKDRNDRDRAYLAYNSRGIQAWGRYAGGYFANDDSGGWAEVGYLTDKIWGNGSLAFAQNHPNDPSRVIVYHAPEASEVDVYTRGSARLQNGRAVVTLDATFPWVTNPDVGLTAHLTPRGRSCVLYVDSLTSDTLTVGSDDPACSDVAFDYMVWGLRIGFEQSTPVQPKEREAFIPSMASHRQRIAADPQLAEFTALERFKKMLEITDPQFDGTLDLSRTQALIAAIHEFDPAVDTIDNDADLEPHLMSAPPADPPSPPDATTPDRPAMQLRPSPAPGQPEAAPAVTAGAAPGSRHHSAPVARRAAGADAAAAERAEAQACTAAVLPPGAVLLPVSGAVEAGDLLVLDPEHSGRVTVAAAGSDPRIVGVATGPVQATDSARVVPVVSSGFAMVKVDAGYGSIEPGDLLVSSPTPGHAMRAVEILPGTVLGKALEPLDLGTGTIRVLLMPR